MIRVMIVATHYEVREGLSMVLGLADTIEVLDTVENLEQAVGRASTDSPDVILVDLEMPAGEGCEAIRRLKGLFPGTKIIALTAHDYPAARECALRAGANLVMVKGLALPEMIAAIENVHSFRTSFS